MPYPGNVYDFKTHLVDSSGASVSLGGSGASAQQVQGTAADGAAAVGNPVQIGGVDGSGNVQALLVATTGSPLVQGPDANGATITGNPVLIGARGASNDVVRPGGIVPSVDTTSHSGHIHLNTFSVPALLNASNQLERARTAATAAATTGTGLLGAGLLGFDGTNYQLLRANTHTGTVSNTAVMLETAANHMVYSGGNNWDRAAGANLAAGTTGTGLLGAGLMLFDATNYQKALAETSSNPNLRVRLYTGANAIGTTSASTDAASNSIVAMYIEARPSTLNDLATPTWDRQRGNTDVTVLASAARTATSNTTFTNYNSTYLRVVLDVTNAGTGSITLSIEAQDAVSTQWVTLLTGAAVTTNSTNTYRVGPGLTAVANATANDFLSRNMRVTVTHNNGNSIVYSVGRQLTGW